MSSEKDIEKITNKDELLKIIQDNTDDGVSAYSRSYWTGSAERDSKRWTAQRRLAELEGNGSPPTESFAEFAATFKRALESPEEIAKMDKTAKEQKEKDAGR